MNKKKSKNNRIKIVIAVFIILLLLLILFTNRNKLTKNNLIAKSEHEIILNGISIPIDNVISAVPNAPVLGAGMIPIKWNSSIGMWAITTQDDTSWYDYANGNYANIMLSDGKYASELTRGKELASAGIAVKTEDLGSIYTWVPKLMYKENEVQYLKQTSFVEYEWTTPSCFVYKQSGINHSNLPLTGMWVSKNTSTTETEVENKISEMNIEDNIYGLIKSEVVQTLTDEEKIVIEKLNLKCGNISNETTLSNVQEGEYKQTIKIINTNEKELIAPKHIISGGNIILKTTYSKYGIQLIFDNNGNIISQNENANIEQTDGDINVFYYVDNQGNIKRYNFSIIGKPSIQNLNPNTTFYVTYDEAGNETSCIPIGEVQPAGWYDYNDQKWANIVTRNNGEELYYVWIPRYMYKLNDNETVDAKLVDLENNYMNESGNYVSLEGTDYLLPDAFTWNGTPITGYWISKYKLRETATYVPDIKGGSGAIRVNNIVTTIGEDYKYEMYLIKDGIRVQGPINLTGNYTFSNMEAGIYSVSIIVKDSEGKHYKGICQEVTVLEPVKPQAPYFEGFDPNITFCVTYDDAGNETSIIPIGELGTLSEDGTTWSNTPDGWYDYDNQKWANIVIRDSDKESYYVWIPRYQYKLDTANQLTDALFIGKDKTTPDSGYEIPDAFTWNETPISGYWISKYKLREDSTPRVSATVAGGFDTIRVSNPYHTITETVTLEDGTTEEVKVSATYEAYLIKDGKRIASGTLSSTESSHTFSNLDYGKYTVHVVAKNGSNIIGGTVGHVELTQLEEPNLEGFMVDNTYIVTYDSSGNENEPQLLRNVLKAGAQISDTGSLIKGEVDRNKVSGVWYNYAEQKWANIVTKANDQTLYYVWIPRYEYQVNSVTQRSYVILIPRSKKTADDGYEIPDAFTWNGTPLSGYWISKYKLRE